MSDGFSAGFDLVDDARRFRVTTEGTVLITPEMLGQRIHDTRWTDEFQAESALKTPALLQIPTPPLTPLRV